MTDVSDVILSKRELNYWSKCTSETMPKKEIDGHIRKSLNPRLVVTSLIYLSLIGLYAMIAYASWRFPEIWKEIFN